MCSWPRWRKRKIQTCQLSNVYGGIGASFARPARAPGAARASRRVQSQHNGNWLTEKGIGWHTFRHTFGTILNANGENPKVIQELMSHAKSRGTVTKDVVLISNFKGQQ